MDSLNGLKEKLYKVGIVFLIVLSLHVAVRTFGGFGYRDGKGADDTRVITLSGHGEVQAVPDIANVYFTIRKEAKTVKEAQDAVALVEKSSLDSLKGNNVEEKDIQTTNASFSPKYEYKRAYCPPVPLGAGTAGVSYYCNDGKQVITGYEAFESITVKIRNTDDVGKIIQDLGTLGVSELNGPNFTVDNEDELKAEARKEAIDDAKAKAKALSKDLGVRLGKITSFNESGNYYGMPIMYAKDSMQEGGNVSSPAEIPKGENTISFDVTITYEIR